MPADLWSQSSSTTRQALLAFLFLCFAGGLTLPHSLSTVLTLFLYKSQFALCQQCRRLCFAALYFLGWTIAKRRYHEVL